MGDVYRIKLCQKILTNIYFIPSSPYVQHHFRGDTVKKIIINNLKTIYNLLIRKENETIFCVLQYVFIINYYSQIIKNY